MNADEKGAQAASQQSEKLTSSADELGNLSEVLHRQTKRFTLSQKADMQGPGTSSALAGMTPETLQRVVELIGKQMTDQEDDDQEGNDLSGQVSKSNHGTVMLPLDQDERGYGEF